MQQALAAGAPADAAFQVAGVGGAQLSAWIRRSAGARTRPCCCCRRAGSSGAAASCWRRTRSSGGGMLIAAGPGRRRRRRRRRARRRRSTLRDRRRPDGAQAGARARSRRPTSRHPVFQPFAANAATLGLVTFQNARAHRRRRRARRWRGSRPATRRWSSARRAKAARSCSRRTSTTAGTTFRCTRRSCRSCTKPCGIWRARARTRSEYLIGDAPAGVPRDARDRRRSPSRPAPARRARRIAVNVDPREADPARLSADEFQSAVTRLKDAGAIATRASKRGSRKIASTSGSTRWR